MKFEKKKSQSKPKNYKGYSESYPMFAFRVPKTEGASDKLERIRKNAGLIYEALKKKKGEQHKIVNKNDILLEALDKGLIQMKKDESI